MLSRSRLVLGAILVVFAVSVQAQPTAEGEDTAHRIPFGSSGNTLELIIANAAETTAETVTAVVVETPPWVTFAMRNVSLGDVAPGAEITAAFQFDLSEAAPVEEAGAVRVEIRDADGALLSERVVPVEAAAPAAFRLVGAYPNPFRERMTIAYELPREAEVTLVLYDVLGRRVAESRERREPGRHGEVVTGLEFASGVYLWQVAVNYGDGARRVERGRITLVK